MKRYVMHSDASGLEDFDTLAEAEAAAEKEVSIARDNARSGGWYMDEDNGVQVMEVIRDWRLEATSNPLSPEMDLVESAVAGREIDRLTADLNDAVAAIHDLQQEGGGWERGVQSERARVLAILSAEEKKWMKRAKEVAWKTTDDGSARGKAHLCVDLVDAVANAGPAQMLPPDVLRVRVRHLERAILDAGRLLTATLPPVEPSIGRVIQILSAAIMEAPEGV